MTESTHREASTSEESAIRNGAPRILLVEDYEANVLVAGIYLESFGYQFDVARNGTEAVELGCATPYAAILMDVQMPAPDGFAATQIIRDHESKSNRAKTPIIGMTAHALVGDRERCIQSGMDDYLSKPFQEKMLKEKLEKYIALSGITHDV